MSRARSTMVTTSPNTATRIGQVVSDPRSTTGVPGTTMPALTKPMNAMKRPMPIAIAFLRSSGIAFMTFSR